MSSNSYPLVKAQAMALFTSFPEDVDGAISWINCCQEAVKQLSWYQGREAHQWKQDLISMYQVVKEHYMI